MPKAVVVISIPLVKYTLTASAGGGCGAVGPLRGSHTFELLPEQYTYVRRELVVYHSSTGETRAFRVERLSSSKQAGSHNSQHASTWTTRHRSCQPASSIRTLGAGSAHIFHLFCIPADIIYCSPIISAHIAGWLLGVGGELLTGCWNNTLVRLRLSGTTTLQPVFCAPQPADRRRRHCASPKTGRRRSETFPEGFMSD